MDIRGDVHQNISKSYNDTLKKQAGFNGRTYMNRAIPVTRDYAIPWPDYLVVQYLAEGPILNKSMTEFASGS